MPNESKPSAEVEFGTVTGFRGGLEVITLGITESFVTTYSTNEETKTSKKVEYDANVALGSMGIEFEDGKYSSAKLGSELSLTAGRLGASLAGAFDFSAEKGFGLTLGISGYANITPEISFGYTAGLGVYMGNPLPARELNPFELDVFKDYQINNLSFNAQRSLPLEHLPTFSVTKGFVEATLINSVFGSRIASIPETVPAKPEPITEAMSQAARAEGEKVSAAERDGTQTQAAAQAQAAAEAANVSHSVESMNAAQAEAREALGALNSGTQQDVDQNATGAIGEATQESAGAAQGAPDPAGSFGGGIGNEAPGPGPGESSPPGAGDADDNSPGGGTGGPGMGIRSRARCSTPMRIMSLLPIKKAHRVPNLALREEQWKLQCGPDKYRVAKRVVSLEGLVECNWGELKILN